MPQKYNEINSVSELKVGDVILCKALMQVGGEITKISDEYIYYKSRRTKLIQPIHVSNIKNYVLLKHI